MDVQSNSAPSISFFAKVWRECGAMVWRNNHLCIKAAATYPFQIILLDFIFGGPYQNSTKDILVVSGAAQEITQIKGVVYTTNGIEPRAYSSIYTKGYRGCD